MEDGVEPMITVARQAVVPVVAPPAAEQTTKRGSVDADAARPKPAGRGLLLKEINTTVDELNKAMETVGTKLSFSVDKETRQTVIKVMDSRTGEVIRQIPSEEMLRISQRITELLGVLTDHAA